MTTYLMPCRVPAGTEVPYRAVYYKAVYRCVLNAKDGQKSGCTDSAQTLPVPDGLNRHVARLMIDDEDWKS